MIEARKDALITIQAGIRKGTFHWGEGLKIIEDDEIAPHTGSLVRVKNGSPDSPVTVGWVKHVSCRDGERFFHVERQVPPVKRGARPQTITLKFPFQREGLGRYPSTDGNYVAYNVAALNPQEMEAYMRTVDAYKGEKV